MTAMKNISSATGLYWFRHDLRLDDQPVLLELARVCDKLVLVFCIEPAWFEHTRFGFTRMGHHRQQFLYETLADLNQRLDHYHQALLVVNGEAVEEISQLINAYGINYLGVSDYPGLIERQQCTALARRNPSVHIISGDSNSLFSPATLPFKPGEIPDKFSPFRKKVEKSASALAPVDEPGWLPPPPVTLQTDWSSLTLHSGNSSSYHGGEKAARKQLQYYFFGQQHVVRYKETRNGLQGWDYSSKFSAWLANGSLSVRRIYAELQRFEQQYGANESTYWLYFELLWREFFWWLQRKHDARWFSAGGIQQLPVIPRLPDEALTEWLTGKTPNKYINACMHELNATGYMSNRARQWAASYLINELQQDWRYGAAYFEQQLIDYDVGANWGNWQYLAGVGSDPRGLRQFNIAKQAQMYDPHNHYRDLWA